MALRPGQRWLRMAAACAALQLAGPVAAQDDVPVVATEVPPDPEANPEANPGPAPDLDAQVNEVIQVEGAGANEEIVVFGELEIARRRGELSNKLRELGYRNGKRKGDKVVFVPEVAWHPTVVVYDDGFVIIKRSKVRVEPLVKGDSPLTWLSCIPPFGLMCIKVGGKLVSTRKLGHKKALVAYTIDPKLDAWQAAVVSNAMNHRVNDQVPALLEATWAEGAPIEVGQSYFQTPEARRAAILSFWAGRADTSEGDQVRVVVETFIELVIQDSPFPATRAELQAANDACRSDRRLPLGWAVD